MRRFAIGHFVLVLVSLLLLSASLVAQVGIPTPEPGPTSPFEWYTSSTGIILATGLGVTVLKRLLGNVAKLNAVPTWIYAIVLSGALTFLANRVWGTLPGELWPLLAQIVLQAAAASGFYEWLNNGSKSLAMSAIAAKVSVARDNLPGRDKL
jgi:hypothetical protein